jgi:hypothetical protein
LQPAPIAVICCVGCAGGIDGAGAEAGEGRMVLGAGGCLAAPTGRWHRSRGGVLPSNTHVVVFTRVKYKYLSTTVH